MDTPQASDASVSPAELRRMLARPEPPLLLDVRKPAAWAASGEQLAGAQRCAPDELAAFATGQPPREVVVYCVYGHAVSQQAADLLRQAGWPARYLAGGFAGGEEGVDPPDLVATWRADAPPRVPRPAAGPQP